MGLIDLVLGCPIKGKKGLSLKTTVFIVVVFMLLAGQTAAFSHLRIFLKETTPFLLR
jgi:hypothetical protein